MADISLPDMSLIWCSGGDVLKPSDSKIQQGWQPEIPLRQWFNWLDNRQDQAIAHIAQHGIAVWSAELEYQAGKSYVQGSDGVIYKCLVTHTNVNPVGYSGPNWQIAFRAVDPLATQSITTNGWKKYDDGFMECWGQFTTDPATQEALITFPQPFIAPPVSIVGSHYGGGGAIFVVKTAMTPPTATQFTAIIATTFNSVATGAFSGTYVAKGRWK